MTESENSVSIAPLAFNEENAVPHEMSVKEIKEFQDAFRLGAQRALAAVFEWLELRAAHGYLMHSFYSPLSNQRTDEYGCSFENRIRFLLETVRAIRPVWPDQLPLTVRISGIDWQTGGWTVDESIKLALSENRRCGSDRLLIRGWGRAGQGSRWSGLPDPHF